jgi:hypothetical protein
MTDYLNCEWTGDPIPVARSVRFPLVTHWTTFTFDHDISDSAGLHSAGDQASIGAGPRFVHGVLDYQLYGGAMSEEVQIRSYEVDGSGERVETHKPHEFYLSAIPPEADPDTGEYLYPKSTHQRWPVFSNINAGHRLRVEITHWSHDGPDLHIRAAQFTGNYFA